MIKVENLTEFTPQIRIKKGEEITLEVLKRFVLVESDSLGVPIDFEEEQIKSGNLFNSVVEDCLILSHPEHKKDYFSFCVKIKRQGTYVFISSYSLGKSKNLQAAHYKKELKKNGLVGNMIAGIGSSGLKHKVEEEENYYQCIADILNSMAE